MAQAGFCSECKANVWLNADGTCANGHPASCVSGVYDAPVQAVPPAKRPIWPWVLGALGLLLLLGLCALVSLVGVAGRVFTDASANAQQKSCWANERVIMGAAATYVYANDGAALPSDLDGLMAVLVPDYLKHAPTCPTGGTYTITPADNGLIIVTCSVHGRVPDVVPTQ